MDREPLTLFALNTSRTFGEAVAARLGVALGAHEEREFEDGEHKIRPLENVRGKDVYAIQSLYADAAQSVNDKLIRLLVFLGALKDADAAHVTAIVPYLAYARKDAKTQPRDPVTTRYIAQLFEAVGADRVVTLDVHNLAAFQNAFRCRTDHLEATGLFARHFAAALATDKNVAVVSPDPGGVKRAERLRQALERALKRDIASAFMQKTRAKGEMRAGKLVGDVAGCGVIVIDDLISTGGTLRSAAEACRAHGATRVYCAATHGLFTGNANQALAAEAIASVAVTDTVPPFRLDPALAAKKLTVLSTAELFAQAIQRIHSGGSIVELLEA